MYRITFYLLVTGCIFFGCDSARAQNESVPPILRQTFKCIPGEKIKLPATLFSADARLARDTCPAGQVMTMAGDESYPLPKGMPSITAQGTQSTSGHCSLSGSYYYCYDSAQQSKVNGLAAYGAFTVEQPYVAPTDYHSLAELAAEDPKGEQIVEVGWTVDPELNGDSNPHLFVFYWVNGVAAPQYNHNYNMGFVCVLDNSLCPGKLLSASDTHQLATITHLPYVGWVVYYGDNPLGYFPDSLWKEKSVDFTQIGLIQWFGEVAASGSSTKTWMGNGVLGTYPNAASVTTMGYLNTDFHLVPATPSPKETDPTYYAIGPIKDSSFNYGGPNQTLNFSSLYVPGTSVIFDPDNVLTTTELASLASNSNGGSLGATPAVKAASFAAGSGQVVTLSASGAINCCNGTPNTGPDGYLPDVDITSLGGISGYGGPGFALLGVFTDGTPPDSAPPSFDYTGGTSQASFAPLLNQVFFVGDGLTGTSPGSAQSFLVPNSATELWLGIADTYVNGSGLPSGYGDNNGSFLVSGSLSRSHGPHN